MDVQQMQDEATERLFGLLGTKDLSVAQLVVMLREQFSYDYSYIGTLFRQHGYRARIRQELELASFLDVTTEQAFEPEEVGRNLTKDLVEQVSVTASSKGRINSELFGYLSDEIHRWDDKLPIISFDIRTNQRVIPE